MIATAGDSRDVGRCETFIVGMSRAGTTWLARSLHRHPEITVFGESAFWGRRYVTPNGPAYAEKHYRRLIELYRSSLELTAADTENDGAAAVFQRVAKEAMSEGERLTPAQFYQRACHRIGEIEASDLVVEKTPHHVHWVGRITASLPDARFLVCIRDPYGFLLSYKHQGERKPEAVQKTFDALYHPIVTAVVARQYLRSILDVVKSHSNRALLVRLEDVKQDAETVLQEIQRFLDVEPVAGLDVGPQNTSFPEGERPSLDSAEIFWLNAVAGSSIADSGYDRRITGRPRASWLWTLITLPVALWRVLRVTYRATERPLGEYLLGWVFPRT